MEAQTFRAFILKLQLLLKVPEALDVSLLNKGRWTNPTNFAKSDGH